ncbi:MAG: TrkH family potassium uptake protein [Tissierellia bacterium]|nr:TrkH family potassium uptake protein [Tissierellia bacterium]
MKKRHKKQNLIDNPAKVFFFTYLTAILIGGALLSLPISSVTRSFTNPLDTTFTAASAVCVTGLAVKVTASYWSVFGKIVIITLIQLGGLGVVTAAVALGLILNKKFSVKDRLYIAEEKNAATIHGMIKLIKYVLATTFIIEGVGAIILAFRFVPEYGFFKGLAYSIFHAISAFCNAGFDILGSISLAKYVSDPFVSFTIMILIILAGLGFTVYKDILKNRKFKKFRLHTKIVLVMYALLIVIPALIFLLVEWNNPKTIANLSPGAKLIASLFQAVTTRTAGFFTVDQAGVTNTTLLITMFLMFIGGAPAGTAGGLKVTTFFTLFQATKASLRKQKDVTAFQRRIPTDIIGKAMAIFMVSIIWVGVATVILTISDKGNSISNLLFEVVSAYGTVGLSRGITPSLSIIGKLTIMLTMIFGKIGPLTMVYVFSNKSSSNAYREAEENILVG